MRTVQEATALGPSVVAIGAFDGVHIGHRQLIAMAVSSARALGHTSAALTFSPHPLEVLQPQAALSRLTSPAEQERLLAGLGVDIMVRLPFAAVAGMAPPEFAKQVLVDGLRASTVCVGFNFRFGKGAVGNARTLAALGQEQGFAVVVMEPVRLGGGVVSSTAVRKAIGQGNVGEAARLLGRPYSLEGTVGQGAGRGRTLGLPTANVVPDPGRAVPADGVYAVTVDGDGGPHAGVANLGRRPTFGGQGWSCEVHCLDFSGDLYGKRVSVCFLSRLRGERKFADPVALQRQVSQDIAAARRLFARQGRA